jgi:hypothetical protein
MTNLGEQFSEDEVDEILREIDVTGNGIIRYEGSEKKTRSYYLNSFVFFLLELVKMVTGK